MFYYPLVSFTTQKQRQTNTKQNVEENGLAIWQFEA